MADVVVTATVRKEGVSSNGKRFVDATLDFDTGDYVSGGIPIPLVQLGLRRVDEAYLHASADANGPYTKAQWETNQDTTSYGAFVDVDTPETPLLTLWVAGSVHSGAIPATWQVRVRLVGS